MAAPAPRTWPSSKVHTIQCELLPVYSRSARGHDCGRTQNARILWIQLRMRRKCVASQGHAFRGVGHLANCTILFEAPKICSTMSCNCAYAPSHTLALPAQTHPNKTTKVCPSTLQIRNASDPFSSFVQSHYSSGRACQCLSGNLNLRSADGAQAPVRAVPFSCFFVRVVSGMDVGDITVVFVD